MHATYTMLAVVSALPLTPRVGALHTYLEWRLVRAGVPVPGMKKI